MATIRLLVTAAPPRRVKVAPVRGTIGLHGKSEALVEL